ncbi:hypothetical protein Tco_1256204 [Tanacetum coccineum]
MNQNYYDPNLCYNSNSSGFDQYQPPQYSVTHQPLHIKIMADFLLEEKLSQALQALCEKLNKNVQEKQEEKNVAEEQATKSEDLSDYKSECDVPVCDDSSSKNEGLDDIVSIPPGKEIYQLDAIPDSVQSLLNRANSIIFLIEEFVGELAPIDPIPPGIVEADFDPKEDIHLIEKLLNDNSSPHTPEEFNSEIPDATIESFSPFPIPVEDSDSLMEEIDVFLASNDSIPQGIENDNYDSEGDGLFLEELLNDDFISLLEYESFHFDFPSSPRPLEKLPDDDVYFDIKPDTGVLTTKVVDDIFDNSTRELYVHFPNVLPTHPTLYPVFYTLLPFSSENEDKLFNPGILTSKKEKSPHFLSHRGFKALQIIYDFSECPMMIFSFPSGTRNKIFDPGIFIEVQSKRFLSPNEFSISFIRDPLSLVFDTLLSFSSENEKKVFNLGSLSSNEEKSPHLLSHRGFNPLKIISDFSESPMMISGRDIPILDVPFLHFYPP